ncbi:MAG: type II CRISPR-associated endonuclease Cas1 [Bacteroidales bacterium]|nr:type II CRISPR-associated endonuclease Cas1 [Bacteroidales bacterium]MBN2757829.1 type II CRISPR-associated endonuclease Cas1 [Bacteroidales bacterium]
MIKRTLYFGNNAYLHTKDKQLVIDFADKEKAKASVPIEDIGVVILDAYQLTISQNLISNLLDNNVALITCNSKRMPQGLMLNLEGNTIQQERFNAQINASLPLKKQLWQQTVNVKIANQRALLLKISKNNSAVVTKSNADTKPDYNNMQYWADSVRSGDPDNYEARAAAFYWKTLFVDYFSGFKRDRFEAKPNNLLNYAYAILRAVTARSLVASGLLPTIGIHHHNKYNAYALADDIMEPYRPYVDEIVYDIVAKIFSKNKLIQEFELTPDIKKELLIIPSIDVFIDGEKSPLMIAMQRTTASLYYCFAGDSRKIIYPVL